MDKMQRPDWAYWRDHRATFLGNAVLLSLDVEPRQFDNANGRYHDFPGYEQRFKLAHMVALAGQFGKPPEKPGGQIGAMLGPQTTFLPVDLADFAAWCVDKRLDIPPEFSSMSGREVAAPALQAVLDRDHQSFAPDLEAAVSAWLAVALEGYGGQSTTFANRVESWLKRNRPYLTQTARKRIVTVCNPLERKRKN